MSAVSYYNQANIQVALYSWLVFWGWIKPDVSSDWKLFSQHYIPLSNLRGVMC